MTKRSPQTATIKSLAEIQSIFAAVVMNPLSASQRLKSKLNNGNSTATAAKSIITPTEHLTSTQRLEIYNRQYWFRLIDCMYDDFPGLRAILGESKFYKLTVAYLKKHPSRSFTLRNLGAQLEEFLLNNPRHLGSRVIAGMDMARFEWAQITTFDNAELPILKMDSIKDIIPQELKLNLQPYVNLLSMDYPLDEFIITLRKEKREKSEAGTSQLQARDEEQKKSSLPKKQKTFLAVHRVQNDIYYKRLTHASFTLLDSIRAGSTLGEACEKAAEALKNKRTGKDFPADVQKWFANWMELGWFIQV